MRAASLIASLILAAGCSKPGGKAKPIPREGDAPLVVVVDRAPREAAHIGVTPEKEPNDAAEQAMAVPLPGGAKGTLNGQKDVDLYSIEVKKAGWLSAELTKVNKVDLMLEVVSLDGKVLALSDRGPATVVEGIPNYYLPAGRYLVRVREFVKKPPRRRKRRRGKKARKSRPVRVGPSAPYELRLSLSTKPAEDVEVEPNESMDTAAKITIADQVTGYMGWSGDVDVWKLSMTGIAEQYSADLDVSGIARSRLRLELLDDKGKRVLRRGGDRGKSLAVRNFAPKPGATFYYLRVTAHRPNPEQVYNLRLSTRLLELDEEVEPNDTSSAATALRDKPSAFKGVRRGFLLAGDVDYYRLAPTSATTLLSVTVTPPQSVDVKVEVLTGKGATLGEANAGKAGHAESFSEIPVASGTPILIKVSGRGDADAPERYQLSWSTTPGAAKPAAPAKPAASPSVDDSDDYSDE